MTSLARGLFITFEGGEGAGKSTQVGLLATALQDRGIACVRTREPGGSPGAEDIRALLVHGETGRWDPISELLLHFAARHDHVVKVIEPALADGKWVICDRFTDSTMAYQGYGQGMDPAVVEELHRTAVGDLWPDTTFVLDISVTDGLQRTASRGGEDHRYERMGNEFHVKLREGFLEIARKNPGRCTVIDATQPIEAIHREIMSVIEPRIGA